MVFDVSLLLGVVLHLDILAWNFSCVFNSTLRVERRKWGKVIARWRSVAITFGQVLREFASLHDRFRLEVCILFYPIRTWKLAAWAIAIITGMQVVGGAGEEVRLEGRAGSGAQPRWSLGVKPRRGVQGAEPPDCHETNLKCFMNKFRHEMRHDLWR